MGDEILTFICIWLLSGWIPSVVYMVVRARKSYYVNIWQPVIGALQGPIALWVVYNGIREL